MELAISQPVPWRVRVLGGPPRLVLDVREVDPAAYTLKDRDKFRDDMYAMMNAAYQELSRS